MGANVVCEDYHSVGNDIHKLSILKAGLMLSITDARFYDTKTIKCRIKERDYAFNYDWGIFR